MCKWKRWEKNIEKIFADEIIPKWLNKRLELESFEEWEKFCLEFDSKPFFSKYESIIISLFGSFKNFNYYLFWMLNGEKNVSRSKNMLQV